MKKILGAAVGVGMLLAAVAPTFAAVNKTTGADSWNISGKVDVGVAIVPIKNDGFVFQATRSRVNTGRNVSNKNTTGGGVTSGDAGALTGASTEMNTNKVTVKQPVSSSTSETSNEITGADSVNVAVDANVKVAYVSIENSGAIIQMTSASVNSGGNTSNKNTVGGKITTGDACAETSSVVQMNTNTVVISQ